MARNLLIWARSIIVAALLFFIWLESSSDARPLRNQVRPTSDALVTQPYYDLPWSEDSSSGHPYLDAVTVDLISRKNSIGSDEAFIMAKLSKNSPATVVAIVKCSNAKGKSLETLKVQAVIFRPGDSLMKPVTCSVKNARAGHKIAFSQVHVPDGAEFGVKKAFAEFSEAVSTTIASEESSRLPFAFKPVGQLVYDLDHTNLAISDTNANNSWSTALSHGRTQPGNPETGYYGTQAMGAIEQTSESLILATGKLAHPHVTDKGRSYPNMASVLSAHNYPQTHFKYGSIEWEARMPSRPGSWPALWLLPVSGWPPEIDLYEGFSHNSDWTTSVSLSSSIHGGKSNKRAFKRWFMRLQLGDLGLHGDLTSEFHAYQAIITPDWITIFVDGVESIQFRNTFKNTTWYPIMTNAVTAKSGYSTTPGSSDMEIKRLKIWKIE